MIKFKNSVLNDLPDNLRFKCKTCGKETNAKINTCSNCKDQDPFYFGEIKRLAGGTNNIVILLGITGVLFFVVSFFTRFSGLILLLSIAFIIAAEYMKYHNNDKWYINRDTIINKQKTYLSNFNQWLSIAEAIIKKEKEGFISQWVIKKAYEKLPKPK